MNRPFAPFALLALPLTTMLAGCGHHRASRLSPAEVDQQAETLNAAANVQVAKVAADARQSAGTSMPPPLPGDNAPTATKPSD